MAQPPNIEIEQPKMPNGCRSKYLAKPFNIAGMLIAKLQVQREVTKMKKILFNFFL